MGWKSPWLESLENEFTSATCDFAESLSDAPAMFSDGSPQGHLSDLGMAHTTK